MHRIATTQKKKRLPKRPPNPPKLHSKGNQKSVSKTSEKTRPPRCHLDVNVVPKVRPWVPKGFKWWPRGRPKDRPEWFIFGHFVPRRPNPLQDPSPTSLGISFGQFWGISLDVKVVPEVRPWAQRAPKKPQNHSNPTPILNKVLPKTVTNVKCFVKIRPQITKNLPKTGTNNMLKFSRKNESNDKMFAGPQRRPKLSQNLT